jgi:EAL domain-containing protein (putative c-di-GMP-specific phosphodiesterase class I)
MDLVAVAEGVETEGQRQFLLDSECTLFQGYLFGKPVPLDQLNLSI